MLYCAKPLNFQVSHSTHDHEPVFSLIAALLINLKKEKKRHRHRHLQSFRNSLKQNYPDVLLNTYLLSYTFGFGTSFSHFLQI